LPLMTSKDVSQRQPGGRPAGRGSINAPEAKVFIMTSRD
jgi:hypothetical protein